MIYALTLFIKKLKEVGFKRKRKLKGSYDWRAYIAIESYMGCGYDLVAQRVGNMEGIKCTETWWARPESSISRSLLVIWFLASNGIHLLIT